MCASTSAFTHESGSSVAARDTERQQSAPASLDVRDALAVDEHDVRARGARRSAAAHRLGPAERGAVRLGRIGGGEHADAPGFVGGGILVRPEPVDGSRQRELGGTEPGDEPAAARPAGLFERAQHGVHARESAGGAFGAHGLARHDAVTVEQLERDGVGDLGGCGRGVEQRRDERPASRARGRSEAGEPTGMRAGATSFAFDARRGTRSGPKVSLVISPAHTRSHNAVRSTASSAVPSPERRGRDVGPERRAGPGELLADGVVQRAFGGIGQHDRRREQA